MAKPIAPADQIALAFPDICKTPTPGGTPPVPYPNVANLSDASGISDTADKELLAGGKPVLLKDSEVRTSTGDEAGSGGGINNGGKKPGGKCVVVSASQSVLYGSDSLGVARFMDQTEQNDGNAQGMILSANPTVLVGD